MGMVILREVLPTEESWFLVVCFAGSSTSPLSRHSRAVPALTKVGAGIQALAAGHSQP
jgi:hypothetical protein